MIDILFDPVLIQSGPGVSTLRCRNHDEPFKMSMSGVQDQGAGPCMLLHFGSVPQEFKSYFVYHKRPPRGE
jgi:hypothetical protein